MSEDEEATASEASLVALVDSTYAAWLVTALTEVFAWVLEGIGNDTF